MEDGLLECTMQDLLRYDDYNNDGHLSLHEFYTAFRESFILLLLLVSEAQRRTAGLRRVSSASLTFLHATPMLIKAWK